MIDRVEIYVHSHATEDPEKVLEAVANLLGLEELPEVEVFKVRGHHGNEILNMKMVLRGKEAKKAVEHIIKSMDDLEYEILKNELPWRSEGSKLYLRFNKQDAYGGKLRLSSGSDIIRVVIVFKGAKVSKELLDQIRES
ncbi:hypothetical protein IPA_08695 [Ignicoccus pacificus DSM 13166]|uniref:Exosome protein n=1 Tax=Ignicoccus pacificus DSM 13166 TaxID=940294 RepID=A0A977PKB6_9CREN|nr:hypothetical protein IPA_08695 [Ignicoccus pacificus DSM 13166]